MNRAAVVVGILLAIGLAGGAGYWARGTWPGGVGQDGATHRPGPAAPAEAASPASGDGATAPRRKILYYRNPMGLADTSPVPKKDPMGMDYLPVYEGGDAGEPSSGQIAISIEKVQKLGVRTEPAAMRVLDRVVRAAGRVEIDERRVYTVSPKFEGWVETLHVNATGQPVGRGQALFEAYSPELVSAQREYSIAAQGAQALQGASPEAQAGMRQLAESALVRLRNWDLSEDQIAALARTGEARRSITFRSPVAGIVTEKKALQGMRFMAGEALYQVADLSSVWVIADVFEQDIALVRQGRRATVKIDAYPDKAFQAEITHVYPTLRPETRTVSVRLELPNPGGLLKPAMFAQVTLSASGASKVLAIPTSAVIDSGLRQIALVQVGDGRFEPRELRLGARSDTHVAVIAGVAEGEKVVVAANFLIDAESNLRAAIGGLAQSGGATTAAAVPSVSTGVGHKAEGTLESVDLKAGTVQVRHAPIASLGWPAMSMEFTLANPSLASGLKPGARVALEIVERKPGEWVITKMAGR